MGPLFGGTTQVEATAAVAAAKAASMAATIPVHSHSPHRRTSLSSHQHTPGQQVIHERDQRIGLFLQHELGVGVPGVHVDHHLNEAGSCTPHACPHVRSGPHCPNTTSEDYTPPWRTPFRGRRGTGRNRRCGCTASGRASGRRIPHSLRQHG